MPSPSPIPLPATKYFRLVKNTTFDYRFVFETPQAPVNLTNYTGVWRLYAPISNVTYAQYETGATAGASGIFFGGDNTDSQNGTIDLVISTSDSAQFTWSFALYSLHVTNTNTNVTTPLLTGAIGIILR